MASKFWIGGTGNLDGVDTTHISDSSGGLGGATYPTSSDDLTFDAASGGGTVTVTTDQNLKSIVMGAFTGTLDFGTTSPTLQTFNGSGTGVRTLNMGSGTWTITGNNTTIFTFATNTNLTLNAGTSTVDFTYSGSTGIRVVNGVIGSDFGLYNIKVSAGTDIFDFANTTSLVLNNMDFTGFTGTWAADGLDCRGSLTLGTGMACNSSSNTINFSATASGKTITSNGVQINRPFTFNGVGGAWTLQDALNMDGASARTLTLTNGTFDANNFNVTCGAFSSSNSNTRVLTMGSGTWTLTGNNATIWTTSTATNLTLDAGTSTINCTYSGSTGTRTFAGSTAINHLSISAGSDAVTTATGMTVNNLNFTGFTGSWGNSTITITGNLTFGTGMTVADGGNALTLTASSAKTITTNSVSVSRPFVLNNATGSWTLQDNFSMGSTSARSFTLTQGTFNANNYNISIGAFSSSNSNTRTLTMGSGTWTLTGTGTVWNTGTTTGLTLNAGASDIVINNASSSSKTFAGGSQTFNDIQFTGAGTGTFIITGSNTFQDFVMDTPPHTLQFTAGTTTTVLSFNVNGLDASNLMTITSATAAQHFLVNAGATPISVAFCDISYSNAS